MKITEIKSQSWNFLNELNVLIAERLKRLKQLKQSVLQCEQKKRSVNADSAVTHLKSLF